MFPSLLAEVEWDPPKWYPTLFDSPLNIVRSIAFWTTLALAIALFLSVLLLKGDAQKKLLRYGSVGAVCYACVLGLTFLIWTFVDDGIQVMMFVPLLLLVLAVGGSALAIAWKPAKPVFLAAGCLVGALLIASLVCIGVYYAQNISGDGYFNSDVAAVNQLLLYLFAALLLAAVVAGGLFFGRKDRSGFDTKAIAYAAVCIALSFALSYLRIVKLPQGGSVTAASLLPLMIYSYMYGTKKGVFAGLVYGVLQAVQDPWIIHPAQFLLDYPIAFAAIGLAGVFADVRALDKLPQVQFALGAVLASALRYVAHVLSGVFAFSAYAADYGMSAWEYSLLYNSFVFADIAIAIVAGVIVFSSSAFVKAMRRASPVRPTDSTAAEEEA